MSPNVYANANVYDYFVLIKLIFDLVIYVACSDFFCHFASRLCTLLFVKRKDTPNHPND